MLRRITELWPNLLRGNAGQQEGDQQIQEEDADADRATDEQLAQLREQTMDIYKNLYWTRIISLEGHRPEE